MLKKALFLVLMLYTITGCSMLKKASIPLPTAKTEIPDEVRKMAYSAIKYGDYYLSEFSERMNGGNQDVQFIVYPLEKGSEMLKEVMDESNRWGEQNYPFLSKEESKIIKPCTSQISRYWASYSMFAVLLTMSSKEESSQRLKDIGTKRSDLIKLCNIPSEGP
jgi:hypothetical protein